MLPRLYLSIRIGLPYLIVWSSEVKSTLVQITKRVLYCITQKSCQYYTRSNIRELIMAKDPVRGMVVDEKTAKHVSEVGGKKVYLC